MSLFPDDTPPSSPSRSNLFGDDAHDPDDMTASSVKEAASQSALFESSGSGTADPWTSASPRGRRQVKSRIEIIKSLLADADIPDEYAQIYDALDSGASAPHGMTTLQRIVNDSGINNPDKSSILETVLAGRSRDTVTFTRNEVYLTLALAALSQQGYHGQDLTLQEVDDHKKNLPSPSLKTISSNQNKSKSNRNDEFQSFPTPVAGSDSPAEAKTTQLVKQGSLKSPGPTARAPRRDSYDPDPWGSPDLHRGHSHTSSATQQHDQLATSGTVEDGASAQSSGGRSSMEAIKSVSHVSLSTAASGHPSLHQESSFAEPSVNGSGGFQEDLRRSAANVVQRTPDNTWGGFAGDTSEDPPSYTTHGVPALTPSSETAAIIATTGIQPLVGSPLGGQRFTGRGPEEKISIVCLPEKDGPFMFQHRNYQVRQTRSGKEVVRRYSDFVWLVDGLKKRYPCRCVPLIPPKSLTLNGHHPLSEKAFLERRRRGLVRFTNALMSHPKLRRDPIVTLFLESTNEVSQWRKQATDSIRNEFLDAVVPDSLESSLPRDIDDKVNTARGGIRRAADVYVAICLFLDRLQKRNKGFAGEYATFKDAMVKLSEESRACYIMDANEVPLLDDGLRNVGRHYNRANELLLEEARVWEDNALEDLKRQRDLLNAMKEMFDRMDRELKTDIPKLEKRIESTTRKLEAARLKPEEQVKPGEIDKLETQIQNDEDSIIEQTRKGWFVKSVIKEELEWFVGSIAHVSKLHQEWAVERVKYAEFHVENWRSLLSQVESMPIGD